MRRGISAATCRYLGCGFLPPRANGGSGSPLHSRLVFQVRGVKENGQGLQPIILSHTGRALMPEQEDSEGKYWSYPFRKGLEIYNQDRLLLDPEAGRQVSTFGLVLVEGYFDVAKLVEAGCRNVGALMGAHISREQIERLAWIRSRIGFSRIVLFLDRDEAGQTGAGQAAELLRQHNFDVSEFDWDRNLIPNSVKDPADLSVEQLQLLRIQGCF
jgi:5S rRNA maturation endonuclease (ribonuclease M5)